jgi:hypothetical protein
MIFRTTIAVALAAFVLASCENTSFYSVLGNKAQIQPLAISPSSSTVSSNGTIQFSASGGVPPYTFSILSGVGSINSSGLYTAPATPGTTYILVTDKQGSTAKATVTNVDYNVTVINDTSTSHVAGSAISGNFTMKNVGTANGGQNVNWAIYLSTSGTLGAGGTVIDANTTGPLAAGASTPTPITFAGTWPTTPGTYYLIATVSAPDGLIEPNNSLATGAIAITAANVNYVASAVTITSGASSPPGGAMTGSFTLTNSGANGGTQFVTWQAYASTSTTTLTGPAVLLDTGTIGPLAAGASTPTPITVTGTWPITYGNYFLVVRSSVPVDVNPSNNVLFPSPATTPTAVGYYSAAASEPGNNLLATAPILQGPSGNLTLQSGMSVNVTGSLTAADPYDYLGFNTGTGVTTVTFNLSWPTTGSTQTVTMYVYYPPPTGGVVPPGGLQTVNNTYLIMPWPVDTSNVIRFISLQLSGVLPASTGTYTLIISAN